MQGYYSMVSFQNFPHCQNIFGASATKIKDPVFEQALVNVQSSSNPELSLEESAAVQSLLLEDSRADSIESCGDFAESLLKCRKADKTYIDTRLVRI